MDTKDNPNAEFEKRVKEFGDELTALLSKHKLVLGAVPVFLPDGRVGAKPHVFDESAIKKEDEKVVSNNQ